MKDIFNGNLKDSKFAIVSLSVFSIIMLFCGIIFLTTALFYQNCEPSARYLLFILASVSFILTITYPVAAIYFVRRMDKYPYISKLFFKEYLYINSKNKKHN